LEAKAAISAQQGARVSEIGEDIVGGGHQDGRARGARAISQHLLTTQIWDNKRGKAGLNLQKAYLKVPPQGVVMPEESTVHSIRNT
jgi:hypothetical protein